MEGVPGLRVFPRCMGGSCQKNHLGGPSLFRRDRMHHRFRVLILATALGFVAFLPFAGAPVAAHEHVTVGAYELIVGWRGEPAVAGSLNGLDLGIEHHLSNGTTVWVPGAEAGLTALLSYGTTTVTKSLEPQSGRTGWYTFDVIPTRPGSYAVRLNGTLESTAVNVTVVLDDVAAASDLAFPVADPTTDDLKARLDAANAALAALQANLTLALAIAVIGLIVAGVGVVGGLRMARGRRKTP